jgi:hypothetical protein
MTKQTIIQLADCVNYVIRNDDKLTACDILNLIKIRSDLLLTMEDN